jgi:hypothetical protein
VELYLPLSASIWSSICTLASSWRNSEELDVTAPARISECPPMSVCTHIHIHGHNAGALEPRGDPCAGLIVHVGAQVACKCGHQVIILSSSCHQVWLSSSHQVVIKSSYCHQVIKLSSSHQVVIKLGCHQFRGRVVATRRDGGALHLVAEWMATSTPSVSRQR